MTFERGYATVGKVWQIPLRLHFTLVLGLLYVSNFRFVPGAWLGYVVLVLMHELGHALLVRRYRLRVFSIEMHALGGVCWHEPAPTRLADSVIAWGGVLGQLGLFVTALVVLRMAPPATTFAERFWALMIGPNLAIMAINLLPFGGLDGARAWQLPKLWLARRRDGKPPKKKKRATPTDAGAKGASKRGKRSSRPVGPDAQAPHLRLVRDKDGDFHFEEDDKE